MWNISVSAQGVSNPLSRHRMKLPVNRTNRSRRDTQRVVRGHLASRLAPATDPCARAVPPSARTKVRHRSIWEDPPVPVPQRGKARLPGGNLWASTSHPCHYCHVGGLRPGRQWLQCSEPASSTPGLKALPQELKDQESEEAEFPGLRAATRQQTVPVTEKFTWA